jgi:uncharacterized Ntn-hydrolase superfamily protein
VTFSLVARCDLTGRFGVAISSSSPAVASRCAHARPGVGAVATQNVTNPALGPFMLDQLAAGRDAQQAVDEAVNFDTHADYRQLLAIDGQAFTGCHSGSNTLGVWNWATAQNCVAAGNLLANNRIPAAMVETFEATPGSLGDRLIAALRAAVHAGGEAGPVHSAGLLIVDVAPWPYVDLRIDWSDDDCPVEALARAWEVYAPQADQYVTRAHNPGDAPAYGVPGDT